VNQRVSCGPTAGNPEHDVELSLPWRPPGEPEALRDREWLCCNGLGGFSSGTVLGIPTRRHHGVLVPNLAKPKGRYVLLSRLDEHVLLGESPICLSGAEFLDGRLECDAHRILAEFRLEAMLPVWRFAFEGRRLEKIVHMPYGRNMVCVQYRLLDGAPITMELHPFCAFRRQDAALQQGRPTGYVLSDVDGACELELEAADLTLRFAVPSHPGQFVHKSRTSQGVHYHVDHERGYPATEDQYSPGYFRFDLRPGKPATFIATAGALEELDFDVAALLAAQQHRARHLLDVAGCEDAREFSSQLVLAADQFIIRPGSRAEEAALASAAGEDARTVIAGYHWFGDWGRDTMISLEGLTLCTGRHREASAILRTFSHYIKDGLLPNLFPEGEREALYHTVDATLWYFHAIDRYVSRTQDRTIITDLYDGLREVIDHHVRGTRFGIGVDANDGLLHAGAPGYQLTWMDAKAENWVVTPRRGKPVEVQALWFNALCLMSEWGKSIGRPISGFDELALQARGSFNARYWNEGQRCLFDVVEGEQGDDPSVRPNQVISMSLKYPILEEKRWRPVLERVTEKLLTPYGLRTLSPDDKDYQRNYHGNLRTRDGAYHQGTVWPWLIGHYVDAWLRVNRNPAGARALLAAFPGHLRDAGIGSISEIFDAERPYLPRGCIAQAWSVAEVLRAWLNSRDNVPGSVEAPSVSRSNARQQ
jgi:predicted glycogen debranching enzyme